MKKGKIKARLLVIDDDPVSRSIIEDILEPEGYLIKTAPDGSNLIPQLSEFQPDVLLMDVLMPGLNGLTLCRQIKSDPHWQHLPVILVTSLNTDKELVAGLDAGADEFISKPVGAAELQARVRSMCRMKQRSDKLLRNAEMREDLANMIVHDMRTPLAVCMLHVDMQKSILKKQEYAGEGNKVPTLESKAIKSLDIIRSQLEGLNTQVDEILLLAKTEQNEIILNSHPVDMYELVQQVAKEHAFIAQRDGQSLQVELSCTERVHVVDANLISRMVGNLVSNAMKYSPIESKIILRLIDGENGRFPILEVIDEGQGIPDSNKEHIFDRFETASSNDKQVRSYGLGLAFCKMVAEAHGATISVQDNAPQGTIFRVSFKPENQ